MATHGRYWDSWVNRSGPGDSRPTALQIIKDESVEGKLTDKTIVVTGGSTGLGFETLRALHTTGATIFITGRNSSKLDAAIKEIKEANPSNNAQIIPIV